MKLKLCRYGNVFDPSFIRLLVILIIIMICFSFGTGFRWDFIVSEVAVLLLYCFLFPLDYPKYIELKNDGICYNSPIVLTKQAGKGFKRIKVEYHVTDITRIELHQNAIERFCGIAHLTFSGKNHFNAGKHTDRVSDKEVHCVYGIVLKTHKESIDDFISTHKNKTLP